MTESRQATYKLCQYGDCERPKLLAQLTQLQEAVDSYLNDCSCKHTLAKALASTEGGE
jgi:hypothetical protein